MRSYGMMQGRLTPSRGRGIQFFPFENWKQEFDIGAGIGINEIEWIFDYDCYESNPLWSNEGTVSINKMMYSSGVRIHSVCFDYFMRRPFFKQSKEDEQYVREENLYFTKRIIHAMKAINAGLLEIPMVDGSTVKTDEERNKIIDFLHEVLIMADEADILIGCETDMPVGVFRDFLNVINHGRIRANYDSGNSSGIGYDHADEIHSLSEYVENVHIKDRVLHGGTVELGSGNADFDKVFRSLKDIGYEGSFILQAARREDGSEAETIRNQLEFVKNYCCRYGLE